MPKTSNKRPPEAPSNVTVRIRNGRDWAVLSAVRQYVSERLGIETQTDTVWYVLTEYARMRKCLPEQTEQLPEAS
jgi:hypothetical protein